MQASIVVQASYVFGVPRHAKRTVAEGLDNRRKRDFTPKGFNSEARGCGRLLVRYPGYIKQRASNPAGVG